MGYKPSKKDREEFGRQMREIEIFCKENNISKSMRGDSYYFNLNGINYRVSNHSVAISDRGMFNEFGEQIRDSYHENTDDVVQILAGKTRIIQIYNDLKAGKALDKRGNVIV